MKKASREGNAIKYESGSIETLRRMVDTNEGITILPELATADMTPAQMGQVRHFKKPAPMREVSIVVHRDYIKKKLIDILQQEIMLAIPDKIKANKSKHVVSVIMK